MKGRIRRFETTSEYYKDVRKKLIEKLGGKCIKCGFSDHRALQFDHVNGKGYGNAYKEHRTFLRSYKVVKDAIRNNTGEFQLLCANCNWIKRVENKEYGTTSKGMSSFLNNISV